MSTDMTPPLPPGWARVTCLDGQPCSEGIEIIRKERPGKAPYKYGITTESGYENSLWFQSRDGAGWTHQHLLLVLINRLTALQDLKPTHKRNSALQYLMNALNSFITEDGPETPTVFEEVVKLRARVVELERQREVLADVMRCFVRDSDGALWLFNAPPGESVSAKVEAALRVLEGQP